VFYWFRFDQVSNQFMKLCLFYNFFLLGIQFLQTPDNPRLSRAWNFSCNECPTLSSVILLSFSTDRTIRCAKYLYLQTVRCVDYSLTFFLALEDCLALVIFYWSDHPVHHFSFDHCAVTQKHLSSAHYFFLSECTAGARVSCLPSCLCFVCRFHIALRCFGLILRYRRPSFR